MAALPQNPSPAGPAGPAAERPRAPAAPSISEEYRVLVDKAYQKFARLKDLPPYGRDRFDHYFQKAFALYSRLWKFQQENRQKLVETGLKRWEIGEIASRISQLYYHNYIRTGQFPFLYDSYVFYEAIASREYFKEAVKDVAVANKQLRYGVRFIVVCLLMNRRDTVRRLVRQLRTLVDDYARNFQVPNTRDWKVVAKEVVRFVAADAMFDDARPVRYSLLFDPHPMALPTVVGPYGKPGGPKLLKLREAILTSYHHNEVKFSELTLDTFRMLQAVEWEPSGQFLKLRKPAQGSDTVGASGSGAGPQEGGPERRENNRPGGVAENVIDPSLPPNPHKYLLFRPTVPQLLLTLATAVEELPPDSAVLVYLSAAGSPAPPQPSMSQRPQTPPPIPEDSTVNDHDPPETSAERPGQQAPAAGTAGLESGLARVALGTPSPGQPSNGDNSRGSVEVSSTAPGGQSEPIPFEGFSVPRPSSADSGVSPGSSPGSVSGSIAPQRGEGLWLGAKKELSAGPGLGLGREGSARKGEIARESRGGSGKSAGDGFFYPSDLLPFTRRPLFLIVDSDTSAAFQSLSGEEVLEPAVMLLSPRCPPPSEADPRRGSSGGPASTSQGGNAGSLFTLFLTAPLLAFCRLHGVPLPLSPAVQDAMEAALGAGLVRWGEALTSCPSLDPSWQRLLGDPFLRKFTLRFIFCRASLESHITLGTKPEHQPKCVPPLPDQVSSEKPLISGLIRDLALGLGAERSYSLQTMA